MASHAEGLVLQTAVPKGGGAADRPLDQPRAGKAACRARKPWPLSCAFGLPIAGLSSPGTHSELLGASSVSPMARNWRAESFMLPAAGGGGWHSKCPCLVCWHLAVLQRVLGSRPSLPLPSRALGQSAGFLTRLRPGPQAGLAGLRPWGRDFLLPPRVSFFVCPHLLVSLALTRPGRLVTKVGSPVPSMCPWGRQASTRTHYYWRVPRRKPNHHSSERGREVVGIWQGEGRARKEVSGWGIWEVGVLGRGNHKCKGPEAGEPASREPGSQADQGSGAESGGWQGLCSGPNEPHGNSRLYLK